MRDGRRVSFWKDKWHEEVDLRVSFPSLFGLVVDKEASLVDFLDAYGAMGRGGKIGPARWASPVHPELGLGWAIKLLARKGPIWPGPVWPDPTRSAQIFFFCLQKAIWPDQPGF